MQKLKASIVTIVVMLAAAACFAGSAKNVIWVIGDGMGPDLMGFYMEAVRNSDNPAYPDKQSHLEKFINASTVGIFFNNTHDTIVTDSAAAATQMACGVYSRPGVIGQEYTGKNVESVMEIAQQNGKAVGVISDSYVTDATPAGFLAHVPNRSERYEIARQMVAGGADIIMGGGLKYFTGEKNAKLLKSAQKQGYSVVKDKKGLGKIKKGKIIGLFAEEAMPPYVEMYRYPAMPTLLEQTQKAIEVLKENKNGFFLMVEAGKIDWSAHDNDAGAVFHEMRNLDEVLAFVFDFAKNNEDTLVYLNADHDTGLGGFNYIHRDEATVKYKTDQGEMLYGKNTDYGSYKEYENFLLQKEALYTMDGKFRRLPKEQQTVEKLQEMLDAALGYHIDISGFENPLNYRSLKKQLNHYKGMAWGTGNHSSAPLLGVMYGDYEDFDGVYHNTEIKGKLLKAMAMESD